MQNRIGLALAWLCVGVAFYGRAGAQPPILEIQRCAPPPMVDGVLTDACWQAPAMITNMHVFKQAAQTRPVRAWVVCDDTWLYCAMDIPHPNPQHIKRTVHQPNGPVSADDSIEIFIDPGTGGVLYFQYMVNALNTMAQKYMTRKADQPAPGGLPWRSGAALNEHGWSMEAAIPLAFLAAYGDPSQCRLNLNVNLVIPKIDPSQVRIGEDKEFLSWAPVRGGFHEPESFGRLQGLPGAGIQTPFFPQFSDLTVERYTMTDVGAYAYALAMKLNSALARPGTALVEVEDRPVTGTPALTEMEVPIGGREKQPVRITVPVTALMERTASVTLKDAATGEIYQRVNLDAEDMAVLRLMSCYLDRSYYTDEPEARAICEFSLPPEELAKLKVTVSHAGRPLAEAAPARPRMQVPVPLSGLAPGVADLRVELVRGDGGKLAGQPVTLVKRAPQPGCEWKVDRINRVLLRDGRPWFGFGIMLAEFNEDAARDIAAAGLDHVSILKTNLRPDQALEHRRLAEQYGLLLMDYLDGYMTTNVPVTFKQDFKNGPMAKAAAAMTAAERDRLFAEFRPQKLELVRQVIATLKDSPNVMGYFSIDEPGCHPEIRDMPARGRELYHAANAADGYHPLFVNFSSDIPAGDEWTDWTDVLGTDPYWITAGTIHRGTPNYLSRITAATDQRGRPNRQPCWIIPMSAYWSATSKRMITPPEQFCQTYLALIHGAKIITYFSHATLIHQANYDALAALARRMKVLGPAIVAPDVPQELKYTPVAWEPEKGLYPSVQARLCAHSEHGLILLCANSRYFPVDVTFRVSGVADMSGMARELFAPDRAHPVTDGGFTDNLEPFGVRAYQLGGKVTDNGAPDARPVAIDVVSVDHSDQAPAEPPEVPRSGRVGKKNLAPNPSFEETSLPELPDYYFMVLGYHGLPPIRSGAPGARYAAVTNAPYHGDYCVRLAGRKSGSPAQVRFCLAPKVEQPTRFTLSIHMRADRDGVTGGLGSVSLKDWKTTYATLSTNWQRVAVSGAIPPGLSPYHQFYFFANTDDSTVWFDAIQLEKGDLPTAFEP